MTSFIAMMKVQNDSEGIGESVTLPTAIWDEVTDKKALERKFKELVDVDAVGQTAKPLQPSRDVMAETMPRT